MSDIFILTSFLFITFGNFGKDPSYIIDTKKNIEFSKIPFQCIFNDFGFLLDITPK